MAEQINDGGSAFPQISTNAETVGSGGDYQTYGNVQSFGGMTLRDYFAAQALNAIPLRDWSFITDDAQKIAAWASAAYAAADAMLAARGDA